MGRMSAKFIGKEVGMSTELVYDMWNKMGLVIKDKYGEWILTEAGNAIGGKLSKSNYRPVPTFDFDIIVQMMIDFYNKSHQ